MADRPLSVAWIQVRADTTHVRTDVTEASARAGRDAGGAIGKGLTDGVRDGMGRAATEAKSGAQKVSGTVRQGLTAGFAAGSREVAAEAGRTGRAAGDALSTGVTGKLREERAKFVRAGTDAGEAVGSAVSAGAQRKAKEGSGKVADTLREGFKASLAGLATGFIGLGAIEVFKGFIDGARESAKVGALTEQVIRSTGGAAKVTASDVGDLATAISNKSGVDDEAIQSGANLLLTFTSIRNEVGKGNDIFNQATSIVTDMSVALGQDMKSSAIQVGKALNDPIKGVTALQRVGVSFTASQKDQIATLVKSGRTLDAQKVILRELGREFGGAAAAASTPMQKLQVRVGNLGETIGGKLLPVIDQTATLFGDRIVPAVELTVEFLGRIPAPVYGAIAALVAGRIAMNLFGKALGGISARGGAGATFKQGLSSLTGFLGGPWGIAFTGATAVLSIWLAKQADAKAQTDELTAALNEDKGAVATNTRALVAHQLRQEGLLDTAARLGLNLGTVTDAALGNSRAMAQVNKVLGPLTQQMTTQTDLNGQVSVSQTATAKTAGDLRNALSKVNGQIHDAQRAWLQEQEAVKGAGAAHTVATRALNAYTVQTRAGVRETTAAGRWTAALIDQLSGSTRAHHTNAASVQEVALQTRIAVTQKRIDKTVTDAETAAAGRWITKLDEQLNRFLGLRGANRDYRQAIADATKAVKDNGRNLDINSDKGRTNQAALDAVSAAAGRVLDQMVANKRSGPSIRTEYEAQRKKLYDVATQFGLSKTAAQRYVDDALRKIPKDVYTKVTTPGLAKAKQDIHNLQVQIQQLQGKNLSVVIDSRGNALLRSTTGLNQGHKAGGYISGPGGPRDDAIPARLSNGEFVVNAAATSQHRALLEAINSGRGGRGYASGGIVRPNVQVRATAHMPRPSWVNDLVKRIDPNVVLGMGGGSFGGISAGYTGGSGVERWRATALQALSMVGESPGLIGALLSRMSRESGGNPTIVNKWDSNWLAGTPSVGLMQVIGPTFARWAGALRNTGPFLYGTSTNPLANIYASLRYAKGVYGSVARAYGQPGGYDQGGLARGTGAMPKYTAAPERVLNPRQTQAFERALDGGFGDGSRVKLHPDSLAELGYVLAHALARQPIVLDGQTVAGYVDRRLGVSGLSVRG